MFNPERKKDFINHYKGITCNNFLENLFNKTESMEKELNKDACDFVKEEIMLLLISFNSLSGQTSYVKKSILKQYTDYCCENNLSKDNINHYDEISKAEALSCANQFWIKQKYISKEKLDELCTMLANDCDKFILYAIFEGIKGKNCEEIVDLTIDNFNPKKSTVNLVTGREIEISNECYSYALKSSESYEYASPVKPYVFNSNLDKVIKMKNTKTIDENKKKNFVYRKVYNIKTMLDEPVITIPHLESSGFVYYASKLAELEQKNVYELVENKSDNFVKLLKKYNMDHLTNFAINDMLQNYLGD